MDNIVKFIRENYCDDSIIEILELLANNAVEIYYKEMEKRTIKELFDIKIPLGLEYHIRLISHFYFVSSLDFVRYSFIIDDIKDLLESFLPKESVKFYIDIIDRIYADVPINFKSDDLFYQIEYIIITIIEKAISDLTENNDLKS